MASNATNVSARRAKAIALIQSGTIHSQSDLVVALKKSGYRVTQATASRDLEEIGAVRGRGRDGESVYQIRESSDDALSRINPVPSKLILSVDHSANLAVILHQERRSSLLVHSTTPISQVLLARLQATTRLSLCPRKQLVGRN
jgi:arginine repressor